MDQLMRNPYFWAVLACCAVLLPVFIVIDIIKRTKKRAGEKNVPAQPEYTTVVTRATVVDQTCCVKMVGIKTPKTVKEFAVVFQPEDGKILRLCVPEQMYDGFAQGQTGVLKVTDGELYSFELGETGGNFR